MADISIIVPIYNAEKYIEKCLDSLVNQTKKELEFILVNDGSTDNTENLIKKYKDKRIKYFKNKNQGIGKTRNFGIEKATGKYLMFLDSDDYLDIDACKQLYEKANNEKLDLVVFDFYRVENKKNTAVIIDDFENSSLKVNPNLLLEINLGPCNKLFKRDLVIKNNTRFLEDLKYEDTTFVVETINNAKKIGKLNSILHYYVIHGNSETTIRDKRIFDILKIVDIIRKYFKNKPYMKDAVDKLTVRILTNYTIQQRNQEDKNVGKKFIDEAFAYLEKEVPDYKDNKYYEGRSFLKRTIEKSKFLSKSYCSIYRLKKNKTISDNLITLFHGAMTTIFIYLLLNIVFNNNHPLVNVKSYSMLIGAGLYVIFLIFINKFLNKFIKNENKFVIISIILLLLIQLIFAYIFAVIPSWDFGEIYLGAVQSALGETALSTNNYFYIYPNNIAYGILLSGVFGIANFIGISNVTSLGMIGILLNIVCIDIALLIIYKIIKEYFPQEKRKLFWLFTIMYTPFITYVPIFYTDTLSLPFIAGALYCLLNVINKKKQILNIFFSGLLLGFGYCLKPTTIIIVIAFIIFYLFFIKTDELFKKRVLKTSGILLIFILPVITISIYKELSFDKDRLNKESIPTTHWIMMGLTGNGGYNREDVDFTKSIVGKEEKSKENIKIIKQRISNLVTEKEVINFYTNKALYVWGDGTYYAPAKLAVEPYRENNIKNVVLPSNSNRNKLFIIIAQSQMIIVITSIILGMIFRKYLNEKQRDLQLFLNITIFGVFLFFLIWEARSRYLVSLLPIILLSSYLGICAFSGYIKNKIKEHN